MYFKKLVSAAVIFSLLLSINVNAQKMAVLAQSVPEAEGVSASGIINFLGAAAKSKTEFHSFMFLRHGKVVAGGWWNPYRSNLKHSLYSTSKSFTATAVGFAVAEKKLSLDDKVISFFPRQLPATISPNLAALTVRDVISMTDGQDPDPTFTTVTKDSDWVRSFLATPIVHKPGTTFLYNTLGTYMLSAIVQKVTGQKVIDYLKPRLFEPLGIHGETWEVDTKGINTGGWGLMLKTEDMAKFGELFLQKGMWNGKRVLPVGWVDEASAVKIMQDPNAPQSKKDSSDWLQGYCYQMWRCRHNAYRADGAFGQFIIIMPDEDAVIAITAETPDMQEEINLVWQYLLPAMHTGKLPDDAVTDATFQQKLSALALPPFSKTVAPAIAANISGKSFTMASNEKHISNISFTFTNGVCHVTIKTDTAVYKLAFGSGNWQPGETNMHGPYLVATDKANYGGNPLYKIDGSYTWQDSHTLQLLLRYIETPHSLTVISHFDGNKVSLDFENSFEYGSKKTVLQGEMK